MQSIPVPEVFLLGGVGAVARFLVLVVCDRSSGGFPAGIVVVNSLASFLGAALAASGVPGSAAAAFGGGFVGSLGTLSSLYTELISLHDRGRSASMALFCLLTLAGGLSMTILGMWVGGLLHA